MAEVEPHYYIQFSVITRRTLFMEVLTLGRKYSQNILNLADQAICLLSEKVSGIQTAEPELGEIP